LVERQSGLGENVSALLAFIDEVDAAVSGLFVVEAEFGDGLADGLFGGAFDLDEGGQVGPGVEVVGDVAELPFFAVVLLVPDLAEPCGFEEFGGLVEVVDLDFDLGGAVDGGGVADLLEGEGGLASFISEA
jgi:hypothetical protein